MRGLKKTGLESILSKIRNRVIPLILVPIISLGVSKIAKADYELKFHHAIDANNSSYVAPDDFYAIGSNLSGVLFGYDVVKDEKHAPNPPSGDWVQAYTVLLDSPPPQQNFTKDGQPFDSNLPDNTWTTNLNAFDDIFVGLSGTTNFNLTDANALNDLPPYALAIVQRQTSTGIPIQNYNLDEDPNISWPVTNVQGIHSKMEVKVIDEYLRIKALSPSDTTINSKHFAVFANKWQEQGPNQEDINGNNKVDYEDLEIFARNWLYDGN